MARSVTKKPTHKRPSWDEYFINMAHFVGTRGTCDRGRSGSVIVRDRRVISTGYVGSLPGFKHCDEIGHEMRKVTDEDGKESWHCVRTSHAEQNAISQAARFGVMLEGATLYCKMVPCYSCAKSIVISRINRVVAEKDYHASRSSKDAFKKAGVKLEILKKETESYSRQ